MKMELSGADGATGIAENEYAEFGISPFDELHEIELSISEALENGGGDILPALYLLNYCRNLAEGGDMEEYIEACTLLSDICRSLPGNRGGRLRPVGDYLDFCID
ncbi:hypothetical protein [Methanolacinia paynteri]|uniref:hypothetical protein n=1 Tax=Methanolacinia paynteri TaxID=230356 RepID=UPI001B803C58|nr:hypothetical protein [Methanolacinia paynteri]